MLSVTCAKPSCEQNVLNFSSYCRVMVVAQVAACRTTDREVPSLSLSWKLFPLSIFQLCVLNKELLNYGFSLKRMPIVVQLEANQA